MLGAYHDGELDLAQRREVDTHMRDCQACREELSRLTRLSAMLRGAGDELPGLSQIGRERLVQTYRRDLEAGLRRLAQGISAVAACILVAGTVWVTTHQQALALGGADTAPLDLVLLTAANPPADGNAQLAEWILSDLSGEGPQ
jgi:anti-sigma factor RsiW